MKPTPGVGMGHKNIADPVYRAIGFEAIWKVIRKMKSFTRVELTVRTARESSWKVNDETVKSFIQRLEKGGFLEVVEVSESGEKTYSLIKDCGNEAPRLKADGTPSRSGRNRENMWRSMRVMSSFDYRELSLTSSSDEINVSEEDARDYLKDLHQYGYLKCIHKGGPRTGLSRYMLIKNTGPKPPIVQRVKQVFDQNTQQIVQALEEKLYANQ